MSKQRLTTKMQVRRYLFLNFYFTKLNYRPPLMHCDYTPVGATFDNLIYVLESNKIQSKRLKPTKISYKGITTF